MRICSVCAALVDESAAFCSADGAPLVPTGTPITPSASSTAATLPARRSSKTWCVVCGATDSDDGGGYCIGCGNRFRAHRSTLPGGAGARIGAYTVLRPHGDCDLLVTDEANETRLFVFGAKDIITEEASALEALGAPFPSVVERGQDAEVGHFLVLRVDLTGAVSARDLPLAFEGGLALVRSVLDAATAIEARGFTWEPSPVDLYVADGSRLVVTRARGATRLPEGEPLNAKRALEALAGALLPNPFGTSSPDLVRLLLPRFNFSTAASRSIVRAREEVDGAERAMSAKSRAPVAELCDPGLRRHHNEDATAVAHGDLAGDPFAVLVVCDGVSSSSRAGQASALASRVVRDAVLDFVRAGVDVKSRATTAVGDAIVAAHLAVCASESDPSEGAPPGTTIVAALVHGRTLTVGWVGDSRAYWVSPDGAELCTTDHSWVNDALSRGAVTAAEAMASPFAHALTRCLGPLENLSAGGTSLDPEVRTKDLPGPCHLVLCTDGLWNYFPSASSIADVVREAGEDADPSAIARVLVSRALAEGGGDNVSVVVYAVP